MLTYKIRNALSRSEPQIHSMLKEMGDVVVAGGALRSAITAMPINDIDIYMAEGVDKYKVERIIMGYGYEHVTATDHAITYKKDKTVIQLITCLRYPKGNPGELFKRFDFTVTMGIYTQNGTIIHREFAEDCAARHLRLPAKKHKLKYPIATLVRTLKYQRYGYTVNPLTMVRIAMDIHALQIKTYSDLKDQLMGIDTTVFTPMFDNLNGNLTFSLDDFIEYLETYFDSIN